MKVSELIEALKAMPPDGDIWMEMPEGTQEAELGRVERLKSSNSVFLWADEKYGVY